MFVAGWEARSRSAFAVLVLALAATAASAVRVEFNPVTVFPVSESTPDLVLTLTATLEGADCQPGLLKKISGGLTFSLDALPGGATAGVDFVGGPATVAILEDRPGGVITLEFQTVIPGVILSDALDEPDESFAIRLASQTLQAECVGSVTDPGVTLAPAPATAIIQDDDLATTALLYLQAAAYEAPDNVGAVDVEVIDGGPSDGSCGELRVHYRLIAGSAEPGDFTPVADGEVAISGGAPSEAVRVFVFPDADGDDETLTLQLFNPTAEFCAAQLLDPAQAPITLRDTGTSAGPIEIRLETGALALDETAGTLVVPVLRAPVDARTAGVHYRVRAGSAETGDFSPVTDGVLDFPANQEAPATPLRVEVFSDGDRDDDTVVVELFDPFSGAVDDQRPVLGTPNAATVTVRDTVAEETVSLRFAAAELAVAETAGSATVEVTRAPATGAVRVTLGITAGSAEPGDFEAPASQVLDFPEGTTSRTVAIAVHADDDPDPETIALALSAPLPVAGGVRAVLGTPATATLTLTDTSSPPPAPARVAFAAGELRVAESDGRVRVRLVREGTQKPAFRARLSTGGSAQAGADYTLSATTVDFGEAQLEAELFVDLVDDRLAEGEERIELAIAAVEGANVAIGTPATIRLRIAASDQGLSLERAGEPPAAALAGTEVELAVLARRVDGSAAAGVGVRWSLEATGGASAEILDGAETVTDAEGRASRRLRIGSAAGALAVRAAIGDPPVAEARFALTVTTATLPAPPPGVPVAPAAPAIERLCASSAGSSNPLCTYLFGAGLSAAEQLAAVEELSGRETTALGTAALAGSAEHLAGVRGRLAALRGGAGAAVAGDLSLQLGGRSVSSGTVVAAVDAAERRRRLEHRITARLAGAGRAATAAVSAPPAVSKPRRWGLFASGRAAFGEKRESAREPGFEFDTFALTLGLDRRLGDDWVVGAALGVLDASHDLADGGELGVDARDLTLFGLWQRPGGFYAQASGTWGTNALDLERRVDLPRRGRETARAEADGNQLALALELGLGRELGAWSVNGFARASRVAADLDGYRERSTAAGGSVPLAALEVADQGVDSLLAEAGLDLAYTAHLRFGLLRPLLRASLLHEAEDGVRAIRSRLAIDPDPTNSFVVPTDDPDRDWASAGLGLQLYTLRGSLFLLVDRELARSDLETTRVTLGFRREF